MPTSSPPATSSAWCAKLFTSLKKMAHQSSKRTKFSLHRFPLLFTHSTCFRIIVWDGTGSSDAMASKVLPTFGSTIQVRVWDDHSHWLEDKPNGRAVTMGSWIALENVCINEYKGKKEWKTVSTLHVLPNLFSKSALGEASHVKSLSPCQRLSALLNLFLREYHSPDPGRVGPARCSQGRVRSETS